jgi:hypothetical protein
MATRSVLIGAVAAICTEPMEAEVVVTGMPRDSVADPAIAWRT